MKIAMLTRRGVIFQPGFWGIAWWPYVYPDERKAGVTRQQVRKRIRKGSRH